MFDRFGEFDSAEEINDLDALDGLEVIFDERFGRDGYIPQYFKDGTEYYLYPVYKTWCTEVRS